MRQDLKYVAYAVSLGYSVGSVNGPDPKNIPFSAGVPVDDLSFYKGNVTVWNTARGWRFGKRGEDGKMSKPEDGDFSSSLRLVLEMGARHD